jgi:hypothetical protein
MKHLEDKIQQNIITALRLYYPDSLVYAIPNGGFRNKMEAIRLKRQGVVAGVSDLHFIHKGKIYFIEVKSENGKQSLLQSQFQKFVEGQGFTYLLVKSTGELLDYFNK